LIENFKRMEVVQWNHRRIIIIIIICLWMTMVVVSSNQEETLIGIKGKDFVLLGADTSRSGSIAWMTMQLDKISLVGHNTVVIAAVGDCADTDRLVGLLSAHSTLCEYECSLGYDVEYYSNSPKVKNDPDDDDVSIIGLSVDEIAHYARNQISESLRSSGRLDVCLLIAGFSESLEETDYDYPTRRLQDQVLLATHPTTIQTKLSSSTILSKGLHRTHPRLFWIDQYGSLQSLPFGVHGLASNFLLSILDQGYKEDMSREEAIGLMKTCFQQLRMRYIIHSPTPPIIKCLDRDGCHLIS
jgi:20S proteasome alpha/beta subunit